MFLSVPGLFGIQIETFGQIPFTDFAAIPDGLLWLLHKLRGVFAESALILHCVSERA